MPTLACALLQMVIDPPSDGRVPVRASRPAPPRAKLRPEPPCVPVPASPAPANAPHPAASAAAPVWEEHPPGHPRA